MTNAARLLFILLAFLPAASCLAEKPVNKFLRAVRDNNIPLAKEAIAEGVKPHFILGKGQKFDNSLIGISTQGRTVMNRDAPILEFTKDAKEILKLFLEMKLTEDQFVKIIGYLYELYDFQYLEQLINRHKKTGQPSVVDSPIMDFIASEAARNPDRLIQKHLNFLEKKGFEIPEASTDEKEYTLKDFIEKVTRGTEGKDLNRMQGAKFALVLDYTRLFDTDDIYKRSLLYMAQLGADMNHNTAFNNFSQSVGSYLLTGAHEDPAYFDEMIESKINFDFIVTHLKGPYKGRAEHALAFILRIMGTEAFKRAVESGTSPAIKLPVFEKPEELTRDQEIMRAAKERRGTLSDFESDKYDSYPTVVQEENKLFQNPEYPLCIVKQYKADPEFLKDHGVEFPASVLEGAIMGNHLAHAEKLVFVGADISFLSNPPEFESDEDRHHFLSFRETVIDKVQQKERKHYGSLLMRALELQDVELIRAVFKSGLRWDTLLPTKPKKVSALYYTMKLERFKVIEELMDSDKYLLQPDVKEYIISQLHLGNPVFMEYRQRLIEAQND